MTRDLCHKLATHHGVLHFTWHVQQHLLSMCGLAGQCEAVCHAGKVIPGLRAVAALIDLMSDLQIKPARIVPACLQACKLSWQSWPACCCTIVNPPAFFENACKDSSLIVHNSKRVLHCCGCIDADQCQSGVGRCIVLVQPRFSKAGTGMGGSKNGRNGFK